MAYVTEYFATGSACRLWWRRQPDVAKYFHPGGKSTCREIDGMSADARTLRASPMHDARRGLADRPPGVYE